MGTGLYVNSLEKWEKELAKQEALVVEAEKAMSPNAKYLRFEFLQKKQSFLKTSILNAQAELKKKLNLEKKVISVPIKNPILLVTPKPISVSANNFKAWSISNMDEQKFVMKVGIMSNANVSIQRKAMYPVGVAYRLICTECNAVHMISDKDIVERYEYGSSEIVSFCKLHTHLPNEVLLEEGRKFRDA